MAADALNPLRGILFKVTSVMVFVLMQACIKSAGPDIPAGQITFYRSAFAIVPIVLYLAVQGELRGAFHTQSPFGHFKRGVLGITSMAFGFYGLVHLPMPDAIAIGYSLPLIAVVLAAIFLGETVRVYRWTAVFVGMIGVVIISWPKLSMFNDGGMESGQAIGAICVIVSSMMAGFALIQTRQLVRTERTPTIVLYFSLSGAVLSLLSLPFGWVELAASETFFLICAGICGGVGQILVTESYRHADVSDGCSVRITRRSCSAWPSPMCFSGTFRPSRCWSAPQSPSPPVSSSSIANTSLVWNAKQRAGASPPGA